MLVAVFILFIGIVGLVLYLVVQSYSRARSEQYDASSLVEEYANNRMITQQGDVVFCSAQPVIAAAAAKIPAIIITIFFCFILLSFLHLLKMSLPLS